MPRVTQRHRDARRQQIIDAARRCFTRSGFHATSMQDIFAEADLSAGAVYRYFESKEDLIAAIFDEVMVEITTGFKVALEREELPSLEDVLSEAFAVLTQPKRGKELAKLTVLAWAEAVRNPALGLLLSARYRTLRDRFVDLVDQYQEAGILDPEIPSRDIARVLTTLGPAFLFQLALLDAVDGKAFRDGLAGLLLRPPPLPASSAALPAEHVRPVEVDPGPPRSPRQS
jgi:AcrR family transcriptional regulator